MNISYVQQQKIAALAKILGFKLEDGTGKKYSKDYGQHKITLDIENNKIIYPKEILRGRSTTQNFHQSESLVVLECVNRLLESGYSVSSIEIEKPFGSGRREKGQWLDLLLKHPNGKTFAMIECKTYGTEHDAERDRMIKNGGQLINYFLNDRDADFLILYSSELNGNSLKQKTDIFATDKFKTTKNKREIIDTWDKTFENSGFFNVPPYNFQPGILKKDLIEISYSDIYSTEKGDSKGTIFNRFAEILRRHAVSDKSNAYNKIFNLFLCKIVDEDEKNDEEEVDFQWKKDESPEEVIGRLSLLYKKGMQKYLELTVTDHSEKEFEQVLKKSMNEKALKMFREIRLYKDNEFAFKEVINKMTFEENATVVKEVIKLLEPYQIKYSTKQQFLGDFFERLLNIGIKQEAGQFFTPIPIARFMVNSLPIKEIIDEKILNKDANFLPYIIDYACGSGHFLTEIMSRIEVLIKNLPIQGLTRPQKENLSKWKAAPYSWCKEFVYGIEKDYRLAKTTKVAAFLNGDGEATVIYGDGLDSFNSDRYRGVLKREDENTENNSFDIVIANPPFSVEGFKETMNKGCVDFNLFQHLGENSDDIECLFIERTSQLLSDGKLAAIVLPTSIFSNKGIHQKARGFLLRNFEILGIQELGKNVFAATANNTAILFLRKRSDVDDAWQKIKSLLKKFLRDGNDFNFQEIQNIISLYISEIYNNKISLEELRIKASKNTKELEKIKYFALTYSQTILVSRFPEDTETAKTFLGYEHSQRDKYEGIHPYPRSRKNNEIISKLYSDISLEDTSKVSTYILNKYNGKDFKKIDKSLSKNIRYSRLSKLINYQAQDFTAKIKLDGINSITINFGRKNNLIQLNDKKIFDIKKGKSITRVDIKKGIIPVVAAGQTPAYYHKKSNRSGEIITISASGAYAGFVNYYNKKIWASDCNTIQLKKDADKKINLKFLYFALKSSQNKIYAFRIGNTNGHVYSEDIENIEIYFPPKSVQDQIVNKLEKMNLKEISEKTIHQLLP